MGVANAFYLTSVLYFLVRTQKPQVWMFPPFRVVYSGDSITMTCKTKGSSVQWFFNDTSSSERNINWTIHSISAHNSGSYSCQSDGQKSDNFDLSVLNFLPAATLSINSGLPVIQKGSAVTLNLEVDDGLLGWTCWVYKNGAVTQIHLKTSRATERFKELVFQPYTLEETMGIYWCSNDEKKQRSSSITIRTSELMVLMETPWPAVMGDQVTLSCVVPGVTPISHAVFYKDGVVIQDSSTTSFLIDKMAASHLGDYKCRATYKGIFSGETCQHDSDAQKLVARDPPPKAVLTMASTMSCSCPNCSPNAKYHYYHKQGDGPLFDTGKWTFMGGGDSYNGNKQHGSYACRAVWENGKTSMSNIVKYYDPDGPNVMLMVVIMVTLVVGGATLVIIAFLCWKRKRSADQAIYEDMPMMGVKTEEGADEGYQKLRQKRSGTEEYETLKTTAPPGADGGYEPLKQKPGATNEYEALKTTAPPGGEGGYESLNQKPGATNECETLKTTAPPGADGGYEPLNQKPGATNEYEALKTTAPPGGEGGYESLNPKPAPKTGQSVRP